MPVVTINDIRSAVFRKLAERFPDIKRFGEEIKQGFQAPCFFVKLFPVEHTRELDRRYFRVHSFDIHYFPASEYSNEEMHNVAEQLYDALEYITVSDIPCRGIRMRHEIVDEVLHFFVEYNFHVWTPRPDDPVMQTLNVEEGVKP